MNLCSNYTTLLEIQKLDFIYFILFYFPFLSVYSIFRTRVRDQQDVTDHSHIITWSYAIIKSSRKFWKEWCYIMYYLYGHLG